MRIMAIDQIASKWNRRAAAATQDYESGVRNPRRPWQAATLDAKAAYEAGVQEAIANDQFSKGVSQSSDSEWLSRALKLGVQRYAPGIRESISKYASKFRIYRDALAALELPPRGPRNSAQNYQRSELVGQTLNAIRTGGAA